MKILIKPFALFSIVALLISCKDEQQVKVEKLTESYSKYLDSLTLEKSEEIVSKWNEIENELWTDYKYTGNSFYFYEIICNPLYKSYLCSPK